MLTALVDFVRSRQRGGMTMPPAGWPFDDPLGVAVLTVRGIVDGGAFVAHVSHGDDGWWQFHDDTPGSPREEDGVVVALEEMVARDATLDELADLPQGWRAWREGPAAWWHRGKVA